MASTTVVLASDDNFAMPLAVAALSLGSTLERGATLDLWILDMGIREAKRQLIRRTLQNSPVEVRWVDSLASKVAALPNTWPAISRATYARLYIPEVLPTSIHRALYLDCDVIARRSVTDLFATEMNGALALGVQDVQTPFVSSPFALPWWFKNGREMQEPNLNMGVLLMDLDAWRDEKIGLQALEYLTDGRHEFGQDQEALNAVAGTRMGLVDPRWNVQSELADVGYEAALPYTEEQLHSLRTDPWIVHYSNVRKPWHHGCSNPWCPEWYDYAARTAFSGWQPSLRRDVTRRARRVPRWAVRKVRERISH